MAIFKEGFPNKGWLGYSCDNNITHGECPDTLEWKVNFGVVLCPCICDDF